MGDEGQGAGQQAAPANPTDEVFGLDDDDFFVDTETGAVFIGDTPVVGRGKRNMVDPPPQRDNTLAQRSEEDFGLGDDIGIDKDGNVDIGDIRVKEREDNIGNIDPHKVAFQNSKMTSEERDAYLAEQAEKESKQQPEPEPTTQTKEQKEWALKVLDKEHIVKDENELLGLAQKGLRADQKFQELADMRKEIEPFYQISMRMRDDPAFVEHVKSYGQANYQIDGPEPAVVTPDQFSQLVEERVDNQMRAQKIMWAHDAKYGTFKGYPSAEEVRHKLLSDSLHWDKFTRDWVDKNPVAYADKFHQTSQKLIREKMLDPSPARPIPAKVLERQKAVLEQLRAKEVAKGKAKLESAKSAAVSAEQDGRLALNRARKRASETGSVTDWADVIDKMGFAD